MIKVGQTIKGKYYEYTINEQNTSISYIGVLKVSGNLGQLDSGINVEITTVKRDSPNLIETVKYKGKTLFVYTRRKTEVSKPKSETHKTQAYGGNQYSGQTRSGLPHGEGKMKWSNCTVYIGEWSNGKMSGYGVMTWPSGKRYEGEWANDTQDGFGLMFYPNGNIYEGEFRNGIRNGHGILRQPNGGYFDGAFIDDKPSGKGVYVDEKGRKYDGSKLLKNAQKSKLEKFWSKTWRLWISLLCLGCAPFLAYYLYGSLADTSSTHVISFKGLIAPIAIFIYGFYLLGMFLVQLFDKDKDQD